MDGVEEAIVALVVQGDAQFTATNDKVQADLTSTERAGRSAESAANDASRATRQLAQETMEVIRVATHAMHLAREAAKAFGVSETSGLMGALDIARGAGAGAVSGARLGSVFGPEGTAIGAGIGGIIGGVNAYNDYEKRVESENQKEIRENLKEIKDHLKGRGGNAETNQALLDAAGIAKLGALLRNP